MLCFDPVVLDCLGGPETISHYFILITLINLTGWVACPTPEFPDALCPVYVVGPEEFVSNGSDPCVPWLDPELGDAFAFERHPDYLFLPEVVAVDVAGNTSKGVCP